MSLFTPKPLKAPFWLNNAHADTVISLFLPTPTVAYQRELRKDSTQTTFVAYDFLFSTQKDAPLFVLFHGLEGSSQSHYALRLALTAQKNGYHTVIPHFRGCGGVKNTAYKAYHCGDSEEIAYVIHSLAKEYSYIIAAGVSLGGSALVNYLGRVKEDNIIRAAVIISAPLNLPYAGEAMSNGINRYLYTPYFMNSMLKNAHQIAQHYPELKLPTHYKPKSFADFDDVYTAPLAGYANAKQYYQEASAFPYLSQITCPTLLINALNDPFMPAQFLPTKASISSYVRLCQPKRGGHVGFVQKGLDTHWLEETVFDYYASVL
ncbi:YheT family hydrolase [Suttonella ornithocola]|uniref:Putative hydrolase n=1 Tax=Suttonella ornithocola TaxID=279832 RepID=A0A380MNY7_9GAMM|nr:alpha/beta fold hydrolase [Suttonella ornithocola]SUO93746.1 putative hydrolase [Suttonella ornithocola]